MTSKNLLTLALLATLVAAGPAIADDDDRHGRRDHKEEFWDGGCKVEREWKKNGDFKEERKCDGGGGRYPEGKTEFRDGPCKVEREWKKNGDFKEEVKCDGRGRWRGASSTPTEVVYLPPQEIVYPPWVLAESGEPVYRPGHEPGPARGPVEHCRSDVVGRIIGGVAGAVIGNRMGEGSDRVVATAGGAIVGVLIGGEIGRRIDAANQACIAQALELAPAGRRVQWPAAGTQYAVVPGPVQMRQGMHCRPYTAEVLTGAGWQRARGSACRRTDGAWIASRI